MKPEFLARLAAAGLLLGACIDHGPDADAPPAEAARVQPATPADGLCAEHRLLKSVCTGCNGKLAVIFKERGDWCAEHGVPESFCPLCHPERGGRPPGDVAAEAAPADGTRVWLRTDAAVQAAGIEVQAALPAAEAGDLQVLAALAYDATRHAALGPPAPGRVQALHVGVGERVEAGAPLLTLRSAELAAVQARLGAARTALAVAETARARAESLLESGFGSRQDVDEALREAQAARADVAAAAATLDVAGVAEGAGDACVLRAPFAGVVLSLDASPGRTVHVEDVLCEIVDATTLWAELDVPEAELGRVAPGQEVEVTLDALPGRAFGGRIESIAPEVDARTRTARARVRLANPDGVLRAGMWARATIRLARSHARALVPLDALQRVGDARLVFVQLAADRYEARRVTAGARRGALVELLDGVQPGEPVATRGSFLLKTETLKGSIGAGCCEVE